MASTARLIANPVSYRVKAAEIDAVVERLRAALRTRPRVAAEIRALGAAGRVGGRGRGDDHRAPCASAATRRCSEIRGASSARTRERRSDLRRRARRRARRARSRRARRPGGRDRQRARGGRGRARRGPRGHAARGPDGRRCARSRCGARRSTRPSGRNPYPSTVVMGAVTARAAGVDEVYVATAPHPVILAAARAVRGRRRLRRSPARRRSPRSPTAPSRSRAWT